MASMLQRLLTVTVLLLPTGHTWSIKGPSEVSGYLGRPLSIECQYDGAYKKYKKYWCKGADWSTCRIVVRTHGTEAQVKDGRFSIKDNHTHSEFTVRLENLSLEDTGIYWCCIEFVGNDYGFPIHVTALPEPTTVTPVIITDTPSTTDVPVTTTTSSLSPFFSDYTILLPTVFLVLLIILIGAILLMCTLKKKKAVKAHKDIPLSLAPGSNSTGEVQYASVIIAPASVASSPQAPSPNSMGEVEYASVRTEPASAASPPQILTNMDDVSYAALQFSTRGDEAIYANVM